MGNTALGDKWSFNYSGFREDTGANLGMTNTFAPAATGLTMSQMQLNSLQAGPIVNHVKLAF